MNIRSETLKVVVKQPLVLTETADKYDVIVNVHGADTQVSWCYQTRYLKSSSSG